MLQRSASFLKFVNGDVKEASEEFPSGRVKQGKPVDEPRAESVEEPPGKKKRLEIGEYLKSDRMLQVLSNESQSSQASPGAPQPTLPPWGSGSNLTPNAPREANQKCSMCQNQYQSVYRCSVWVSVPGQRKQNVYKLYCDMCWHFMVFGYELKKNIHLASDRVRHHALHHLVRAQQIMRKEAERQELIDDNRFPEEQSLTLDAD